MQADIYLLSNARSDNSASTSHNKQLELTKNMYCN